jgi:hypothetical protein
MGAAMISLVDHAHDGRTPAATAWVLCAGAAVVRGAAMLLAASLQAWHRDRGLYQPVARTCAAVAVACLGVGAARPAPLILGLALVLLLSIPWGLAVARRPANPADPPAELPRPASDASSAGASMRDHGGRNASRAGQLQAEARDHGIDLRVVELDVTTQESAATATGRPEGGAGVIPGGCGCPRCWWDSLG